MALNVTPIAEKAFTDEMLAKNFVALAENSQQVEEWFYLIESRLGEITRQNMKLAQKLSGRKTRFALGVAVGVAISPLIARKIGKLADKLEATLKEYEREKAGHKGEPHFHETQGKPAGDLHADVVIGEKGSAEG